MKRIIIVIVGLMTCFGGVVGYGEERANGQDIDVISKEARMDKIKVFVNGFEAYAKKIIENYKKELAGIEAKDKAEKYNGMMDKLGGYFRDRDFNLHEWLLIQQEFDKRYEIGKAEYDQLGSEVAYDMVKEYLDKDLPQSLSTTALNIVTNKEYATSVRKKYALYIRWNLTQRYNKKMPIKDEDKTKIVGGLVPIIEDETTSIDLRSELAYMVADYFGENEKAVRIILWILSNPKEKESVKSRALSGISMWGVGNDQRIKEKIINMIKNRDRFSSEIVNNAIRSAVVLQDKEVAKILLDILQNTKNEKQFKEARYFLQGYHDKETMKSILKNYNRFGEEKFCLLWPEDMLEDVLIEIINEGSDEYLLLAIRALGENTPQDPNKPTKVVKALERQLYHPNPQIRITSISAILKVGEGRNEETKNEILTILNKAKSEEKNKEVLNKIENGIKSLEGGQ